jgi:hypothetical protein
MGVKGRPHRGGHRRHQQDHLPARVHSTWSQSQGLKSLTQHSLTLPLKPRFQPKPSIDGSLLTTTVLRHPEFQSSVRTADASGGRRCSQDSTSAFPRLPLLCPLGRSGCMGQRSLGDGGGLQGAGRGQWHWDTPPPTDFPCPYNSPVSRAPPKP